MHCGYASWGYVGGYALVGWLCLCSNWVMLVMLSGLHALTTNSASYVFNSYNMVITHCYTSHYTLIVVCILVMYPSHTPIWLSYLSYTSPSHRITLSQYALRPFTIHLPLQPYTPHSLTLSMSAIVLLQFSDLPRAGLVTTTACTLSNLSHNLWYLWYETVKVGSTQSDVQRLVHSPASYIWCTSSLLTPPSPHLPLLPPLLLTLMWSYSCDNERQYTIWHAHQHHHSPISSVAWIGKYRESGPNSHTYTPIW